MDAHEILTLLLFLAVIAGLTPVLGRFLFRVFSGERTVMAVVVGPVERLIYRLLGVRPEQEQSWSAYAVSVLALNLGGFLLLFGLLRLQGVLPLNPVGLGPMAPDLAFNTAVSFVTNTNWQAYSGETTLSLLSQMAGLGVQNFLSAATGLAVAVALMRGIARRSARTLGNFYVDMTRGVLYVLLPLSLVGALILVQQGVPQTLEARTEITTLEGSAQTLALGPVASQIAIKTLGTNGGGFYGQNAAHPFENPTPVSNFLTVVAIFALGAALTNTYGRMVGDQRQGWVLLGVMGVLFVAGVGIAGVAEHQANPALASLGLSPPLALEGKEVRFGLGDSTLFAVVTTAASCGAVNAMHDSLMPLAGMVSLVNMLLGEIIVGGVGAGYYGMMLFVLLTLFLAGLMVGRTPEYRGKKIEAREITLAVLAILAMPLGVLVLGAVSALVPSAAASMTAEGPHGLSQLIYAYASATANNGSAFAGFGANTPWQNILLGLAMLLGRFLVIVPVLAIAGSLAAKRAAPETSGTFPTHGPVFAALLLGVIVVVGGLTFTPVLVLGPIADHLTLLQGATP
ncbi:potassium-transporting ATPase subunit KdpA [Pararhodospirillum photometricum]|uniref:Potassium-transporting ATPase potassium-binding subunit n=1 Tax=Pararhodospirillum photometricum DSM 122 TaxID=1150469 RepID=H6SP63_PARPM|nr:potassium-transporting ATPase subunit KdpA [Pararhodospirillum photometricum]CCG07135.1 Potassium-transporting ATPase A chain [Pararhodospirillum photometricum DSM 122]